MMSLTKFRFFVLPLALLLLPGCSTKTKPSGLIVARVNSAYLTLEEANKLRRELSEKSATLDYVVSQWIDGELLYQAALKNDLYKDETLNKTLDDFERNLLGNAYLETIKIKRNPITNEDVRNYYEQHKSSFFRLTDEAKIYHFTLDDKTDAALVKRTLTRRRSGGERKELFSTYRVDAVTVKKGFLIKALDDAIFASRSQRNVVGPIEIDRKFHVLEILERYKKDTAIGLDDAYDEIYQRLLQQQLTLRTLYVLDSLRLDAILEINLETVE